MDGFASSYPERGNNHRPFCLLLPRHNLATSTLASSRRPKQISALSSSSKNKKKNLDPPDATDEGGDVNGDDFEALYGMLEEKFKDEDAVEGAEDDYEDISEEDLQRELEAAFGVGDDEDEDVEVLSSAYDDGTESEDEEEARPLKIKNWQLRRLARALKTGKRKISVECFAWNFSYLLCEMKAVVLDLLRDPPPTLVMMSAALPEEPEKPLLLPESKPIFPAETTVDAEKSPPEEKVPIYVKQQQWFGQKRLKKVQIETLEEVYSTTKRPTNTMISSIVHVTRLPRKRVIQWFEDKRTEQQIPKQIPKRRLPYQRLSSS
ncbi:hypothetical protein Tsubulata_008531 [Turnera subulata]|uniref:Homeobox domain-containing protein n=1 Tax=Turnera subulata TaxID=218843 RepID=A0A9Q0FA34_9ROSI|nr:hypothetical protein Tsubulata_008531 [Turnera subulata]